jgi:hypothetical protein
MPRGNCLCGKVVFEISGEVTPIEMCHCPRCRKAYGAAFATTFYVAAEDFGWLSGEELIEVFDAPIREQPPAYRHPFCRSCGSPLPIDRSQFGFMEVPAGLMDDDPGCRPRQHIYVGAKAPWFTIADAKPQHEQHAPPEQSVLRELKPRG